MNFISGVPFIPCCIGSSAPVNLPSLMDTYHLTTAQVDSKIRQKDISYLAVYFDNVEHYVDAMELTSGEKNDVKKCADHREAMIKCLNIWIRKKCSQVTFRILLDMLVKLKKEEIASKVCQYLVRLCMIFYPNYAVIFTPSLETCADYSPEKIRLCIFSYALSSFLNCLPAHNTGIA